MDEILIQAIEPSRSSRARTSGKDLSLPPGIFFDTKWAVYRVYVKIKGKRRQIFQGKDQREAVEFLDAYLAQANSKKLEDDRDTLLAFLAGELSADDATVKKYLKDLKPVKAKLSAEDNADIKAIEEKEKRRSYMTQAACNPKSPTYQRKHIGEFVDWALANNVLELYPRNYHINEVHPLFVDFFEKFINPTGKKTLIAESQTELSHQLGKRISKRIIRIGKPAKDSSGNFRQQSRRFAFVK